MMTFGKPARFQLLTLSAVVINALLMIASARGQLYGKGAKDGKPRLDSLTERAGIPALPCGTGSL